MLCHRLSTHRSAAVADMNQELSAMPPATLRGCDAAGAAATLLKLLLLAESWLIVDPQQEQVRVCSVRTAWASTGFVRATRRLSV